MLQQECASLYGFSWYGHTLHWQLTWEDLDTSARKFQCNLDEITAVHQAWKPLRPVAMIMFIAIQIL